MSKRSARIALSIIMLISVLTLILSGAGFFGPTGGNGALPSPSSSTAETTGTTVPANLSALPIDLTEPGPTPATGLRRWPAEPCLPVLHTFDLTAMTGRQADQQPLSGITVILDPGHGGVDGGTQYPLNAGTPDIVEKNVALAVALKARSALESLGATVFLTREDDSSQWLYKRIALASQLVLGRFLDELPGLGYYSQEAEALMPQLETMININSDLADSGGRGLMQGLGARPEARLLLDIEAQYPEILFISLHCNALPSDTSVHGLQVYYITNDSNYREELSYCQFDNSMDNQPAYTRYDDAGRLRLATALRDSIQGRLPELDYPNGDDLRTGDYAVLRELNLVAAMVEMGFVTNEGDRALLLNPDSQQAIAQGVADAVFAYYCGG